MVLEKWTKIWTQMTLGIRRVAASDAVPKYVVSARAGLGQGTLTRAPLTGGDSALYISTVHQQMWCRFRYLIII